MSTSDGDAMPLQTYRAKRDFDRTPEPRGSKVASRARGGAFVVQKHAARHLHYDFRLELDGVLVSWAVPKGPSLDPSVKRLAMHVEDHPLEYGGFEGVIPQGEYGGGTVMVWDKGSWIPRGDPIADYRDGRLKFTLRGKKLKGSWMLIRTRGYESKGDGGRESWLLIKEADEYARAGDGSILETDSVVSGRSLEEIAKGSRKRAERRSSETRDETVRARPAPRKRRQSEKPEAAETQPNDEIAGIKLSNPDKLYFPEAGLTKRDLALYYERVAPWILPHIERRPLSLVRCPDGWTKQCFYQKHADRSVHDAVTRVEVPESTGPATYFSANSAAALVALVQWGVIELHPWAARSPRLERPDRLIFDFDPDASLPWGTLVTAVHELRAVLAEMHLIGFLKTTGGKGLHVVLPIRATLTWEEAKSFSKGVADLLVRTHPDLFITTAAKDKREGKIFIDYLRNAAGATAIAPYGVRARERGPVATPIAWSELATDVRFDYFNVGNIARRLNRRTDPWADFLGTHQVITAKMRKRLG